MSFVFCFCVCVCVFQGVETEHAASEAVEESCGGIAEEECLMRRTLAAHLDYIYTQNHKP